jgi:hypothetical protein
MSTLTASPFSLAFEAFINVRVSAHNSIGYGSTSSVNSATQIRSIPSTMTSISLVSKTDTDITLTWSALTGTSTGDSTILSYELLWDNGLGTVSIQLIDTLVYTYTVSGLTGGASYQFKVCARNIYGYGAYSNVFSVTPSDVPD